MERELTVDGLKVIAHKWDHDPERTFNYAEHVEQLQIQLELQQAKQKPLLVVVYGVSGCGKTMLARVLAENANNAEYVNCWLIAFNLLPHCNLPLPGVANQSHHHFHGKYHLIG